MLRAIAANAACRLGKTICLAPVSPSPSAAIASASNALARR
jgi:hypothetical protein